MHLRSSAWVGLLAALALLPGCGRRAEAMPNRSAPTAEAPPAPRSYTVQPGDGWFKIASDNQVTLPALLAVNDATTATAIHPGQTLRLPSTDTASAVAVVPSTRRPPTPVAGGGAGFEGAGGGTLCSDGSVSGSTGRGTCSHHGGVSGGHRKGRR